MPGVAFKKTFSYAGFEMQPKKYTSPKIALLNIELELKAERTNAEVCIFLGHFCKNYAFNFVNFVNGCKN